MSVVKEVVKNATLNFIGANLLIQAMENLTFPFFHLISFIKLHSEILGALQANKTRQFFRFPIYVESNGFRWFFFSLQRGLKAQPGRKAVLFPLLTLSDQKRKVRMFFVHSVVSNIGIPNFFRHRKKHFKIQTRHRAYIF